MVRSRLLRGVIAGVALLAAGFLDYQAYKLSTTPVSGTIENVFESQGRHSSTLFFLVKFSYGTENINAEGYRGFGYKNGDTFTSSCQYVPLVGCAGMAYTGYVDNVWGRNSLKFMLFKIFLFAVAIFLAENLYSTGKNGRQKSRLNSLNIS